MTPTPISTFYSDNGEREAVVLTDGYGVYVIQYYWLGSLVDSQEFPKLDLHTVECIAEDYVEDTK